MIWRSRLLVPLALLALSSTACGLGGTLRANARGAKIAEAALHCPKLDTVFAVPHRYMTNEGDHLYRGCDQYALVSCTVSLSAPPDQEISCVLVEALPAAVVLAER